MENIFEQPSEEDKEIVAFVVNHCDRWRDYRNTNYLDSVSYTHLTLPTTPYV